LLHRGDDPAHEVHVSDPQAADFSRSQADERTEENGGREVLGEGVVQCPYLFGAGDLGTLFASMR